MLTAKKGWMLLLVVMFQPGAKAQQSRYYDVVVYGATRAGIAISAARGGVTVVLLEELVQVGGMASGGLSFTHFNLFLINKEQSKNRWP